MSVQTGTKRKEGGFAETIRVVFHALIIALVIRTFLFQPFNIPSGSMIPTLLVGDYLFVSKYSYGYTHYSFPFSPPFFSGRIFGSQPQRGDVVVFRLPKDDSIDYIKRLIGLPGDHVESRNKVLYINGKEMKQIALDSTVDDEPAIGGIPEQHIPVEVKEEDLDGVKHRIFVNQGLGLTEDFDVVVPPGNYFMMGDNRDNSDDSRMWGFVPDKNLIGKAFGIWMSWDAIHHRVRWDRIGTAVK